MEQKRLGRAPDRAGFGLTLALMAIIIYGSALRASPLAEYHPAERDRKALPDCRFLRYSPSLVHILLPGLVCMTGRRYPWGLINLGFSVTLFVPLLGPSILRRWMYGYLQSWLV